MVHAVHAGITQSQMCHTTRTKLNLVRPSPRERAFVFLLVECFSRVFNLGGLDQRGGGNRYQSHLLISTSPNQVLTPFNSVVAVLPLGCQKCCH